jgi:hypothetical protein
MYPSRWTDRLLGVAFTLLAVAVLLYLAARLIESVWPVLVAMAIVALLVFLSWSAYQFWKSRW